LIIFTDRNENLNSDFYQSDNKIRKKLSNSKESQSSDNYKIFDDSKQQQIIPIHLNNSENKGGKLIKLLILN